MDSWGCMVAKHMLPPSQIIGGGGGGGYPSKIKHKKSLKFIKKYRSQFHIFKTIIDSIKTIQ